MRTFTGIQAMRGVAAFAVACGHVVTQRFGMGISDATANAALGFFQSGVDIFFVISGFIVSTVAAEIGASRGRAGVLGFAAKRVARIYPLYWIVLAAAFVTGAAVRPDPLALHHVLLTKFGLNAFVPQAWTLYFEINFYATVAAALLIAPKFVMEVLAVSACVLLAVDVLPLPKLPGAFVNAMVLEFGIGVLIAFALRRDFALPSWPKTAALFAAALFAAGASLAVGGAVDLTLTRVATYGVGSGILIYAVVAAELNGARFPRAMQYLGAMSYSLYLWHFLIFRLFATSGWLSWMPGPLQWLLWFVTALAVSAASYEWIERPILRWAKQIGRASPTSPDVRG
jgi:exopolysaccharide production protein ExoZ